MRINYLSGREKPEGWKESGKRINRGLYRSKDGIKINADCNAAGNILRKVAATLGLCLKRVSRGALISTSESSYLDSSRIPVPLGLGSINRKLDFLAENSPARLILEIMCGLVVAVSFAPELRSAIVARSAQSVLLSKISPQTSWLWGILAELSGI